MSNPSSPIGDNLSKAPLATSGANARTNSGHAIAWALMAGANQPGVAVMMPGMDGPTTFKRLHLLPGFEKVPVAFVTAKVQPQEVNQFIALGAIEVIAKPFDPMLLADQVRQLWGNRRHG